ncbi:MAG: UDP-N-acetylglucosamine 2-epimerase (hydrolyzing), partial [Alphaproteobacteria bacterium]|nr:UDP-N-acetylglucosamine 2-epimerase (hydrolyzing) [Alphaproteobacteria bacterium]
MPGRPARDPGGRAVRRGQPRRQARRRDTRPRPLLGLARPHRDARLRRGRGDRTVSRRRIGIVTSARSDFGLLRGLIDAVRAAPELELIVYATGMHHSRNHGYTLDEVKAAGFAEALVEIPSFQGGDSPEAVARTVAAGVSGFAAAFAGLRPDILVVLGDRYDSYPAALAALPFAIPIAHVSGGESTEGAIDEAIRHSLTKLAHLHFPSHQVYARRIRQMGEEAWRITLSGQPGLDALVAFRPRPRADVIRVLGLDPARPVSLLTYHPETLAADKTANAIAAVLQAAHTIDSQIVFTAPNADTGNAPIREAVAAFAIARPGCVYRESLGRDLYLELLNHADCMVGNSSSGIIEAASFKLPVVDIGDRQKGRLADRNVIRCPGDAAAIADAWRRALDPAFRAGLAGLVNSYGDGHAVPRILAVLQSVPLDRRLIVKT